MLRDLNVKGREKKIINGKFIILWNEGIFEVERNEFLIK